MTLALSLTFEPAEPGVMRRPPPRADEPILSGFMWWRIGFVSLVMMVVTFGLFVFERERGASVDAARTVAVNTLVVLEIFYLFSTRYLADGVLSARGLLGSRLVPGAIAAVLLLVELEKWIRRARGSSLDI